MMSTYAGPVRPCESERTLDVRALSDGVGGLFGMAAGAAVGGAVGPVLGSQRMYAVGLYDPTWRRTVFDWVWRIGVLALIVVTCCRYLALALGLLRPDDWVPSTTDILFMAVLLLGGDKLVPRELAPADQLRSLAGDNARLQADNARLRADVERCVREADQVRERLETELRYLRQAYGELRREQFARSQSVAS